MIVGTGRRNRKAGRKDLKYVEGPTTLEGWPWRGSLRR